MHIRSALFFRAYIVSLFLQFHINKENEKEYVENDGEIKNITELKATYSYVYRYLTNHDNEIYDNITSEVRDSFLDYLYTNNAIYIFCNTGMCWTQYSNLLEWGHSYSPPK